MRDARGGAPAAGFEAPVVPHQTRPATTATPPRDRNRPGDATPEHMMVVVRVRGLTERERQLCALRYPHRVHLGYRCLECTGKDVIASDPDSPATSQTGRRYAFDRVFDEHATTEEVYVATVEPLLPGLLEGYNATCFAYGMTGAGKTYTMMGTERSKGLCYMAVEDLFPRIETMKGRSAVHASYLEIYNEKVKDLLSKDDDKRHEIVEDPVRGVVVTDLAEYMVESLQDLHTLITVGCQRRTKASTASNVVSSRSHAILLITVKHQAERPADDAAVVTYGKLALIDLAGSERATPGEHQRGVRLQEGANINRSLLALGNCITVLGTAKGQARKHVPYRDSKLTRLLKDSLGGNTRTTMIGNASPSSTCYEEIISTLKYATRARNISRCVTRNAVAVDAVWPAGRQHPVIDALKTEIAQLRTRLVIRASERGSPRAPRPTRDGGCWFRPMPVAGTGSPPRAGDPTTATSVRRGGPNALLSHHPNMLAPRPSAIPEVMTSLRSALARCHALESAYAAAASEDDVDGAGDDGGYVQEPPAGSGGGADVYYDPLITPLTFPSTRRRSPLRRGGREATAPGAQTPPRSPRASPGRSWRPPGTPSGAFPPIVEPPRNQEREQRRRDQRRRDLGLEPEEPDSPGLVHRSTHASGAYFDPGAAATSIPMQQSHPTTPTERGDRHAYPTAHAPPARPQAPAHAYEPPAGVVFIRSGHADADAAAAALPRHCDPVAAAPGHEASWDGATAAGHAGGGWPEAGPPEGRHGGGAGGVAPAWEAGAHAACGGAVGGDGGASPVRVGLSVLEYADRRGGGGRQPPPPPLPPPPPAQHPRYAGSLEEEASRVRQAPGESELSTDDWGAIHALLQDLPKSKSKWREGTSQVIKKKMRVWRTTPH